MRPTPSRRKSSNLLASLARQNTLSEREKERQRQLFDDNNSGLPASSDADNPLAGFGYAAPSRDVPPTPSTSSYAASYAALNTPSMVSISSSYSTTSAAPTLHNTPTSSSSFGANLENLRSVVQKRMQTFSYIKRLHECRVHWCNTILLSREELEAAFDNTRMAKRSVRFAVLGMSTSMLLDITAAHDFLRALLSLLSDFDAAEDDENLKFKTKNLFKAGKGKRPSGTTDYALPLQDGDPSYVFAPNIPFDLDYSQVLFTLCDIMNELYGKIASFLGPSTGTSSLGTIGAFPQPQTASPLRHGLEPGSFAAGDRRAGVGLSPMLVEVVYKIDSKIKKIVTLLTKEIDQLARQSIKDQLDMVNRAFLSGKDDVAFPM